MPSYTKLTDGSYPADETSLFTSFETLYWDEFKNGRVLSSWFTAP